jgi:hypothetical protein
VLFCVDPKPAGLCSFVLQVAVIAGLSLLPALFSALAPPPVEYVVLQQGALADAPWAAGLFESARA